jgi:type II secretory ATPase GspE/PulE/Tfp pilus assembly ATPase PilB-like protein
MPNQPPRASSVGQTLASIRHSPSDDQQLTTYNLPAGKAGQQSVCRTCQGTKYRGRTPIVEALVPTHGFNELIARKATVEEFEQKAKD